MNGTGRPGSVDERPLGGGSAHWFLREPARPRWVASSPRAPWLVVGTVCIGAFIGQLDASIVSIALPAIGRDLGGSTGQVEWVALSYLLTLVALVAPIGRLADSVGRKLLYTYGFAVFAAASLGCALAANLIVLDLFRVLQAVGAAMLQANSVALIAVAVPRARLGRAVGVQGAAQAIGLALGPAVGGDSAWKTPPGVGGVGHRRRHPRVDDALSRDRQRLAAIQANHAGLNAALQGGRTHRLRDRRRRRTEQTARRPSTRILRAGGTHRRRPDQAGAVRRRHHPGRADRQPGPARHRTRHVRGRRVQPRPLRPRHGHRRGRPPAGPHQHAGPGPPRLLDQTPPRRTRRRVRTAHPEPAGDGRRRVRRSSRTGSPRSCSTASC